VGERGLEVHERDPLVDREPLDLREHRRVRRVEEVAAVHVAGHEHPHRRRVALERAHLHRGGVRAEQHVVAQ
jgi:hypothetical protein